MVDELDKTEIVDKQAEYFYAVKISRWVRYKDDLEFLLDEANNVIQVRSASRVGYYDFKVNRDRIELLRTRMIELGFSQ